jgi:hypothetical protein
MITGGVVSIILALKNTSLSEAKRSLKGKTKEILCSFLRVEH